MSRKPIGFRIPEKLIQKTQATAKERGITFTDLVEEAMEIFSRFDLDFYRRLTNFSERLGISKAIILQNTLAAWFGARQGMLEFIGKHQMAFQEFSFSDAGPLDPEEIYDLFRLREIANLELQAYLILGYRQRQGLLSPEEERILEGYAKKLKDVIDVIVGGKTTAERIPRTIEELLTN